MQVTEVKCRNCGKKLLTYSEESIRRYESPVRKCKQCGTTYADPRCHEIAIEGVPVDTLRVSSYVVLLIIGALITYRGIYLFGMRQLGLPDAAQWIMPTVCLLGGLALVIGGIVEIIMIKTGRKTRKFKKLAEESERRLSDPSYAMTLQFLGYHVPDRYL